MYPHPDNTEATAFWSLSGTELTARLRSGAQGLAGAEAARRLRLYGLSDPCVIIRTSESSRAAGS